MNDNKDCKMIDLAFANWREKFQKDDQEIIEFEFELFMGMEELVELRRDFLEAIFKRMAKPPPSVSRIKHIEIIATIREKGVCGPSIEDRILVTIIPDLLCAASVAEHEYRESLGVPPCDTKPISLDPLEVEHAFKKILLEMEQEMAFKKFMGRSNN